MPVLEVAHLVKEFPRPGGLLRRNRPLRAVDNVSFSIDAGETLALVGESGCGKTTTGRCVLRLVEPTSGDIRFRGTDLRGLSARALREMRRHMQIVFQDPYSSLNPRMRAGDIVEEPLVIHRVGTHRDRAARVRELFDLVGLDGAHIRRYPAEFSGGQRQRIGIARALALEPSFIVADEPVSALDLSIQAQIVKLLVDLQVRLGLAYLFITHDLRVAREIATRVAVMCRGRLVEVAPAEALFARPAHPYTRSLLSAMPLTRPGERLPRIPFDDAMLSPAPLREIAAGHFAAV
jgi:oligopeptide transport system ATP-binding protein